jgi:galactoside O-acetyltransferase
MRAVVEHVVSTWPGAIGNRVRRWYYGRRFEKLGAGADLGLHLLVHGPQRIRIGSAFSCWRLCTLAACADGRIDIGNHVSLNANVYLNACSGGTIRIGSDVLIGPNVVMRASDHSFEALDRPMREQGHVARTITIEDDVWLGANVTVVGGVHIGRSAVVAAGAVVTRNVDPETVVGGVPARLIRTRTSQDLRPGGSAS